MGDFFVGGRYIPVYVLNSYGSTTGKYSSVNAETLIKIRDSLKDKELPDPIVYENSGSEPVKLDLHEFSKAYYSEKILN